MSNVLILGAGPGGFDAALYAASHGLSVTLIEAHKVGGTCLNYGCIPTKALYQNAKMIHHINQAKTFGVNAPAYTLDYEAIKTRKETIVDGQIKAIHTSLKKAGVNLVEGYGELIDSKTVRVNDKDYTADHIVLATGSKAKTLTFPGSDLPIIHTSKSILELNHFPKKLLVVGAGVIGTEMAQIFQAFGAQVTLIDFMDDILMTEDADIRKRARNLFKRSGIDIHLNASLKEVVQSNETYSARFETKKGIQSIETDAVLLAVGRQANTNGLNLDTLNIDYTHQGVTVNANKQTSLDSVYAIGDLNGEMMLAHKATYDGYRAINHMLNKKDTIRFDLVPSVIFSTPLIASVGKREDECNEDVITVKALFKANAKAIAMDDTDGFIKLIASQDRKLIGAHIIGNSADALIHELTALIQTHQTIDQAYDLIHAHPTVSETIHDALKQMKN